MKISKFLFKPAFWKSQKSLYLFVDTEEGDGLSGFDIEFLYRIDDVWQIEKKHIIIENSTIQNTVVSEQQKLYESKQR